MNHGALSRVWLLPIIAVVGLSSSGSAQQIVQRGALGRPGQVLDETQQWSTPLLVAKDADVEIYIPDITNPDWLKQNYESFRDEQQFTISMFTFYRTPNACQKNQTGWGQADADHLNACIDSIGYRMREGAVDAHLKTVTLIMAAMVNKDGTIDPTSVQHQAISRTWAELDENTQAALVKTSAFVAEQMRIYDAKMQKLR
jgi:hypothetical protein